MKALKHCNLDLRFILSLFLCSFFLPILADADEDIIRTIILINREAELVDIDKEGEVLRRYVAIPDYFTSGRSHNASLRQSLAKIKDYGLRVNSTSLPGSSKLPAAVLQTKMIELIACISTHTQVLSSHLYDKNIIIQKEQPSLTNRADRMIAQSKVLFSSTEKNISYQMSWRRPLFQAIIRQHIFYDERYTTGERPHLT